MATREKIGIFGGSFNPFHKGHMNSIRTVMEKAKLDRIFVVPSNQSPLKVSTDGPTAEERLNMVQLGVAGEENIVIDEQEIRRGGTSYTIDTIRNYLKSYEPNQLHLIIGIDAFETFSQWKNYSDILTDTNLIVTTRPGFELPKKMDQMPRGLENFVKKFTKTAVTLKSGRTIKFIQLEDIDVSATDLRKHLRGDTYSGDLLEPSVREYIQERGLYKNLKHKIADYREFAKSCAQILFDRKAIALRGFDLTGVQGVTDFALIASGTSTRQTSSLAENLVADVKKRFGINPLSIEGVGEGRWVVVDYGSLIIHLFYDYVRQEYRLEELWRDGIDMQLQDKAAPLQHSQERPANTSISMSSGGPKQPF